MKKTAKPELYPVSSFAHSDEKNARHDELDSAIDRSDSKASDAPCMHWLDVIKLIYNQEVVRLNLYNADDLTYEIGKKYRVKNLVTLLS